MERILAEADADMVHLGAGYARADLAPRAGGSVAAFRWEIGGRVRDWLRPATAAAIAGDDAEGMACFPLAPYSNRIRNGKFTFGDRCVALPARPGIDPHCEHGHGWRNAWAVVRRDAGTALLQYHYSGDTAACWPWPYLAEQYVVLTENDLAVTLGLTNLGDRPMPCGIGLHPYFPATSGTRLNAAVAGMWETDDDILPTRLVAAAPPIGTAAGIAIDAVALDNAFIGWDGVARITWLETGATLALTAEAPLRVLVLYTPGGAEYFCAEPVSNVTDAVNLAATRDDTGLLVLAPGGSVRATVRFTPSLNQTIRIQVEGE